MKIVYGCVLGFYVVFVFFIFLFHPFFKIQRVQKKLLKQKYNFKKRDISPFFFISFFFILLLGILIYI